MVDSQVVLSRVVEAMTRVLEMPLTELEGIALMEVGEKKYFAEKVSMKAKTKR